MVLYLRTDSSVSVCWRGQPADCWLDQQLQDEPGFGPDYNSAQSEEIKIEMTLSSGETRYSSLKVTRTQYLSVGSGRGLNNHHTLGRGAKVD